MKNNMLKVSFPFILMAIPWIYLAAKWGSLPAIVPVHFGIDGTPDKYGSKNQAMIGMAIITGISVLVYFILRNIYKIDPKRYASTTASILAKISVVVIIFMALVSTLMVHWTITGRTEGQKLLLVSISLLIAYIGNVLYSIKPNYFAGFRLPWTLENEENWRLTHHYASRMWFTGGITLAVLSLFIKSIIMFFVLFGGMMILVFFPVMYSYKLYKRSKLNSQENNSIRNEK